MGLVRHPAHVLPRRKGRPVARDSVRRAECVGVDFESDFTTGEPKLMSDDSGRQWITPNMTAEEKARALVRFFRRASFAGMGVVHWSVFDRLQILRVFLDASPPDAAAKALATYGKVEHGEVYETPGATVGFMALKTGAVVSLTPKFSGGVEPKPRRVSVFNAKQFYYGNLESAAASVGFPYTKGARELHLIDWGRYAKDEEYASRVRASNVLDAQAARALLNDVSDGFNAAFFSYPKSMFSAGSLCKTALSVELSPEAYRSIGFFAQRKEWLDAGEPENVVSDVWCASHESYSGGLIDCHTLGNVGDAWISDVSACYPAVISTLPDLRGSRIVTGRGAPPYRHETRDGVIPDLVFVRGHVTVPRETFHSLSYKTFPANTKSRRYGEARYCYTLPEREWLAANGATFRDETWLAIETRGIESPIARSVKSLIAARKKHAGTSAERRMKEAVNAVYGATYELNPVHDLKTLEVVGYKPGDLYNSLLATYITAVPRVQIARAARDVTRAGGRIGALMTDSLTWNGPEDALPSGVIAAEKTPGFFEPPARITEYLSLGVGRYTYRLEAKGKWETKHRGYRFPEEESHDIDLPAEPAGSAGPDKTGERAARRVWHALREAVANDWSKLKLYATFLVSPGLKRVQSIALDGTGIGLVLQKERELNPLRLGGKRLVPADANLRAVLAGPVPTRQLGCPPESDNTLPELRRAVLEGVGVKGARSAEKERVREARREAKRSPVRDVRRERARYAQMKDPFE